MHLLPKARTPPTLAQEVHFPCAPAREHSVVAANEESPVIIDARGNAFVASVTSYTARTKRVPIIFLTARADEAARVRGLAAGADDYVVKPFSMQELVLRVRGLLRRSASLPSGTVRSDWI